MRQLTKSDFRIVVVCAWLALLGTVQAENDQTALPIPDDVKYSIISETEFRHFKHSIEVRLNKKVPERVLRTMAAELKGLERKNYERTFIAYYLPEMKVGSGAWATTHYDPDLDVQILGLTVEEENSLTQEAMSHPRDTVGIWMDDRPYVGAIITIYREKGKLYLETTFEDGSSSTDEMIQSRSTNGTKLVEKDGNSLGEYFVLDSKGGLHSGDREGLFLKYKKVQ